MVGAVDPGLDNEGLGVVILLFIETLPLATGLFFRASLASDFDQ